MKKEIDKKLTLPIFASCVLIVLSILFSLLTINRFPPVTLDEVNFSLLADNFLKTGRIYGWTGNSIIHPKFDGLSGYANIATQGVFLGCLGLVQKVVGIHVGSIRTVSLILWAVIGFLLFFGLKKFVSLHCGMLSAFIWLSSFEVVLSGHLIRPEMMLALFLYSSFLLFCFSLRNSRKIFWILSGILVGLAPGVHPNGLYLIPFLFLLILICAKPAGVKFDMFIWYSVSIGIGILGTIFLSDFPNFFQGTRGIVGQTMGAFTKLWFERLLPHNLLADSALNVISPYSFYSGAQYFQAQPLWLSAAMFSFLIYLFSGLMYVCQSEKNQFLKFHLLGLIYFFFAVGYGHIRPEMTYNFPITLMGAPLVSWILIENVGILVNWWKMEKEAENKITPILTIGVMGIALCWFIQSGLILFLLALLSLLNLEKRTYREKGMVLIGGLFLIFSLWVRNANFMKALNSRFLGAISSVYGWVFLSLFIISATIILLVAKKNGTLSQSIQKMAPPYFKIVFLTFGLGLLIFSSVFHHFRLFKMTPPLENTLRTVREVSLPNDRLLGPNYFWFEFGYNMRSIEELRNDYYYSGQKKPWEAIERYKPSLLVLNEEFIRTFMLDKDHSGQFKLKPIESIIRVPFQQVVSIPPNPNHTGLIVYRLFWPS